MSILTTLLGVALLLVGVFGELPHGNVARASTATTSVTVLNTPPQWDTNVYVQELTPSATETPNLPTNSGWQLRWYASSTDSSNDNYYVLICNNYASPTPNSGAAPTCNGGNTHQIAVSAATQSGTAATLATTTSTTDPTEIFYYYAYLCDGNATGPACNPLAFSPNRNAPNVTVATDSPALSPFIVNHRPTFTAFVNSSPKNPGASVTWYASSSDSDTWGGFDQDQVKLFVCKAQDFSTSTATGGCGAGGTWATSSVYSTTDASATLALPDPDPKGTFPAYGYIIDKHGNWVAAGAVQSSNSAVTVNNVAPTISAASISLLNSTDTNPLLLTNLATSTTGFRVVYDVTDHNSCSLAGGGNEIAFGTANVYRSGIGSTTCNAANQNPNNCYVGTSTSIWTGTIPMSCSAGSCSGTTSLTQTWTCTFPLWFVADPTDVGSKFPSENWLASAQAADTSFATSSLTEGTTGNELLQFLAYDISTSTIAYGGLQPGQDTGTVGDTVLDRVDLKAEGNVGLDETLYGADMCPTYPVCSGNATSTIFVNNQKYASSSVAYAAATSLLANPGALFALHVQKTTSTSTLQAKTTYWGIAVPAAITLSGDYVGQDSIIGATSPSSSW